ncbi:DUF4350 domain-containing protein [Streptomyces xinghaiensis]|uniref:DUF4350 domain-containing protein n=1 Tax=Streptomyces xinghaiensis TaxID=1038928 RepID=UPI00031F0B5C|nr:DUF4350 domain-containing protein [Streptomyces xinghaiensis]MZE76171.1 DUF4350 domain-containing protein [Streptomyces sp. SID5475]
MTRTAAAETSATPTAHQLWTRSRGLLLALAVLVLAGIALAAVRSGEQHGRLDPRSADRYGSRAVAELLADRGVRTTVVTATTEAAAAAGPDTTLLITNPDLLTERQRKTLRNAATAPGVRTVLLAPGPAATRTLAPAVQVAEPAEVSPRSPDCDFPAARRAGDAEVGGIRYSPSSKAPEAESCYLSDGLPTLVRLPDTDNRDTVLLGSPDILFNDRLAERGNASLALQLLGSRDHLVWYLPSLDDAASDGEERGFLQLLPSGWSWAVAQLGVAAVFTALWRARRLGPLTPERLPVTIRASETTEGRARLYHQAHARDRAAEILRSATRTRLAPVVGVAGARAHRAEVLCPALASHVPGAGPDLPTLLFGPVPPDDRSLIRLADELDRLERTVTAGAPVSPTAPPDAAPVPTKKKDTTS